MVFSRATKYLREYLGARGVSVRTADYIDKAGDDAIKIYMSLGMQERWSKMSRGVATLSSVPFSSWRRRSSSPGSSEAERRKPLLPAPRVVHRRPVDGTLHRQST